MHINQPVPASLIECVPAGLLCLDEAGRIALANPAALDLLGRSVFDCLDRPVEDVLGMRPRASAEPLPGLELVARTAPLVPPYRGEIVSIERAGSADPRAGGASDVSPRFAQVEAALERAADAMPRSTPAIARHELVRALDAARRGARQATDREVDRLLDSHAAPPAAELAVARLVQDALVRSAAEIRLAQIEVSLERTGHTQAHGDDALARHAIDAVLARALAVAGPGGTLSLRIAGEGQRVRIALDARQSGSAPVARAPGADGDVADEPSDDVDRARRIAQLLGGSLHMDAGHFALELPASTPTTQG